MFDKFLSALGFLAVVLAIVVVGPFVWPIAITLGIVFLIDEKRPAHVRTDLQNFAVDAIEAVGGIVQILWILGLFVLAGYYITGWLLGAAG